MRLRYCESPIFGALGRLTTGNFQFWHDNRLAMMNCLFITILILIPLVIAGSADASVDQLLSFGDSALSAGSTEKAIEFYRQGIGVLSEDDSILTAISLHTNYATALSSEGKDDEAAEAYQNALLAFKNDIGDIVDENMKVDATAIAAQAAFFLGMVYQDLGHARDAVDAYSYANSLDPLHWAAMANLGAILHDEISDHASALAAYNRAYTILTNHRETPTDPPPDPKPILSQLQYRIGLCISHDLSKKCAVEGEGDQPADCKELAANAFSLALRYDPENEPAKHMLATITADATMKRASNSYVKSLFDDYASNFEHSLVQELGYNGFERLRRGFDRAFGGAENVAKFDLVIDAGCGTGLVGEQFRNVSSVLIGVDLSEAILEQAVQSRPNLYDEVVAGDVTEVFRERKPISLIIAADSYIYFGDLAPLFQSMADGLSVGGYAAFTLENVDEDTESRLRESKPDWRWQLTSSGRFAHRKEYVLSVGNDYGLGLVHYEPLDNFRSEHGVGVRGHIFVVRRQGMDQEL